jgi:hypothetical protein
LFFTVGIKYPENASGFGLHDPRRKQANLDLKSQIHILEKGNNKFKGPSL